MCRVKIEFPLLLIKFYSVEIISIDVLVPVLPDILMHV